MIVEGMLFVGHADGRPLTNRAMAGHIRDVSPQEVDAIVTELNEIYDLNHCCYTIVSEGAGYRLQLRPEHEALRQRMSGRTREARLTPQVIEVLSVVAYRQPISAEEVTKARGSRSDALLNQLIRRGLLQLERTEAAAKPVYRTTERFNQLLNIKSPAELPRSEDLDDN
jgi:segregation and condensation protein B